jgi:hypothetical protein
VFASLLPPAMISGRSEAAFGRKIQPAASTRSDLWMDDRIGLAR